MRELAGPPALHQALVRHTGFLLSRLGMVAQRRFAAHISAVGLNPHAVKRLWQAFNSGGQGLYWSRMWGVYALIDWCHRHSVLL